MSAGLRAAHGKQSAAPTTFRLSLSGAQIWVCLSSGLCATRGMQPAAATILHLSLSGAQI